MGITVLSISDGISCGQTALRCLGLDIDNYYACETNKYAIKVTQTNYPTTVQLGGLTNWKKWGLPQVDLVLGKSVDSILFFHILKHYNPDHFVLDSGKSGAFKMNDDLVSAHSKQRAYRTNILQAPQPIDKRIKLVDVLGNKGEMVYCKKIKPSMVINPTKAIPMTVTQYSNWNGTYVFQQVDDVDVKKMKGKGVECQDGRILYPTDKEGYFKSQYNEVGYIRQLTPLECERLLTLPENYTDSVSKSRRYRLLGDCWTVDVIYHIVEDLIWEY